MQWLELQLMRELTQRVANVSDVAAVEDVVAADAGGGSGNADEMADEGG